MKKNFSFLEAQTLRISSVILVLAILGFSYNRDATDNSAIQLMLAIAVGVVIKSRKQIGYAKTIIR